MADRTGVKRFSLNLKLNAAAKLKEVLDASKSKNMTELMRRTIALYQLAFLLEKRGGQVIFRERDGQEEVIVVDY